MSDVMGGAAGTRRWVIDGNNVFGSRPDGWWNDRAAAQTRFTQRVAEWCRTHDDEVVLVFDPPVDASTAQLGGGNLRIVEARRRGRDAADHEIAELVTGRSAVDGEEPGDAGDTSDAADTVIVVTSDRGLRERVPATVTVWGVGRFRDLVGY